MATLTGKTIAATYTSLLKLEGDSGSTQAGASGNAVQVKTGDDDATPLYLNTDRVGIGTATPASLLNISGTSSDTDWTNTASLGASTPSIIVQNTTNTADTFSALQMIAKENSNDQSFAIVNQATTSGTGDRGHYSPKVYLSQRTASDTFTAALTIDEDANVGIGTTSPASHLDVEGTGTQEIRVSSTDGNAFIKIASDTDEGQDSTIHFDSGTTTRGVLKYEHDTTAASQKMTFKVGDDSVTAMTILGSGNVGIGTTAPASTQGYGHALEIIDGDSGTSKDAALVLGSWNGSSAENKWEIGNNTSGVLQFVHSVAGDGSTGTKMVMDASGNLGIGETSPLVELDVAGRVAIGNKGSLTISSGVITITESFHRVATESAASSDNLDTINGFGATGCILVLVAADDGDDVVIKDGTGNIVTSGGADFTLDHSEDTITFIYNGSNWIEIARSTNS